MKNSNLFIDLDGTLVATDTLWESVIVYLKANPLRVFLLLFWLLKGKVHFKSRLAEKVDLNPAALPYRTEVLEYIKEAQTAGNTVVLATAAHRRIAESVAGHLKLFSKVLASDGQTNLSGVCKLQAIQENTNGHSFQYMGDAAADLPIWEAAETAIVVNPSASLLKRINGFPGVTVISSREKKKKFRTWIKAIRIHQWSKNLLLFLPMLMAHRVTELNLIVDMIFAFISFSFCASTVYILNDLLDLESDRQHPSKKNRPFATGELSIKSGFIAILLTFAFAFSLSLLTLPKLFTIALGFYLALTTFYSFYLKKKVIVDAITLGSLYTFRILAGAIAISSFVSSWLLAFSMFFFFSMALIKRYTDLRILKLNQETHINGRGYIADDIEIVRITGIVSGYLSLLVLALYINGVHVKSLYAEPALLWLLIPCLMYWITRIWFLTHRGYMTEDPIVFAIKDYKSYIVAAIIIIILILATTLTNLSIESTLLLTP